LGAVAAVYPESFAILIKCVTASFTVKALTVSVCVFATLGMYPRFLILRSSDCANKDSPASVRNIEDLYKSDAAGINFIPYLTDLQLSHAEIPW